ncbi:hypothetical protein ACI77I_21705 [Pseudomonas sp. D47]|uniref:hypothetical protein n=1 Tax=Pseudomonas sp. D47 TaxID=3159447 RepID=UPI00387B9745
MSRYTFEEKSQMREHAKALINEVGVSASMEDLNEHYEYASVLIATLPSDGVCTDEEATEWKFQLGTAQAQATERLESLS